MLAIVSRQQASVGKHDCIYIRRLLFLLLRSEPVDRRELSNSVQVPSQHILFSVYLHLPPLSLPLCFDALVFLVSPPAILLYIDPGVVTISSKKTKAKVNIY